MNTIQYSPRIGALYVTGVSLGPPESSTQAASQSLQPFLPGSIGDRPTDRPPDHAIRSVSIGGAHSGEAKFCYCLRLEQVFNWSSWLDRSDQLQQVYMATPIVVVIKCRKIFLTGNRW